MSRRRFQSKGPDELLKSTQKTASAATVLPPKFLQRLMKEVDMIKKEPIDFVEPQFEEGNITKFIIHFFYIRQQAFFNVSFFEYSLLFFIHGPKDSIYENELFALRITVTPTYPMDCPIVVFVPPSVPKHEV